MGVPYFGSGEPALPPRSDGRVVIVSTICMIVGQAFAASSRLVEALLDCESAPRATTKSGVRTRYPHQEAELTPSPKIPTIAESKRFFSTFKATARHPARPIHRLDPGGFDVDVTPDYAQFSAKSKGGRCLLQGGAGIMSNRTVSI